MITPIELFQVQMNFRVIVLDQKATNKLWGVAKLEGGFEGLGAGGANVRCRRWGCLAEGVAKR
ncbi:MAG: hypothetical protein UW42_C0029G0007 [Candidatus Collierbacteria bacterium GW2011_GWB1_44_197]|nr:MAG: hypothetical protein UW42_C0029G0007 [Candidatus Collierbacteria bacterium GW2011_GWB1_44_197]